MRQRTIMIVDCGSRDNLPDYIWFCAQLGLPYLAATFGVAKQNPSLVPGAIRSLPFVSDMPDPAHVPVEVVELAEAIRCARGIRFTVMAKRWFRPVCQPGYRLPVIVRP